VGCGYGYNVDPPLAQVKTKRDVDAFPWPTCDMFDYSSIDEECEKFARYALFGGQWGGPFTQACDLVGTEKFLMMMVEQPELAYYIMGRIVKFFNSCSVRQYEAAKGRLDIYFAGDDFGIQHGTTISRKLWKEMVMPHVKPSWDLAHKNGLLVELHSCGSIADFLPDMIEMGLNAIEPVQVRARDMEFESLVRRFAGKVVLHGSIDTQQTLPFGTPDDVRREVKSRCDLFRARGGFVLGASQHLMPEIPLENIYAMYDAAKECRGL
jgi:uroporphyrinogen decarboxylase